MIYTITAHPTKYSGVLFRSRLEARWAAFFDLIDWRWEYEPVDLEGWTPDFRLHVPCKHTECATDWTKPGHPYNRSFCHVLYVEVKPYDRIEQFIGHPAGEAIGGGAEVYHAPHPACFGVDPSVTLWTMVHGHGGGEYSVKSLIHPTDAESHWKVAGNRVQYRVDGRRRE